MAKLVVVDHPLIMHKLTKVRDAKTSSKEFRENVSEIAALLTYEITRDIPVEKVQIETPMCKTESFVLSKNVVIVPILRAGLGMIDGICDMIPNAKIGHIGIYRSDEEKTIKEYYSKLPKDINDSFVLLVDPMLATGKTTSYAIDILKKNGVKLIKYVGLVASPTGIDKIKRDHPDVDIYVAAIDEKLDDNDYIVPGLGDCGDRLFGTK